MSISLRKSFLWLAVPVVLVFGLLLWLHGTASADVPVFQDDFDSDSQGAPVASLNNWTITAGSIDVLGDIPTAFVDIYPGNGNYLDMDGTCGNATITSPSLTLPAGTYQLSFEIGVNPSTAGPAETGNGLLVSLGTFSQSFSAPSPSSTLTPINVTIVVPTATTASLVFQETGIANCGGSILDDVLLTVQPPVSATICHKGKTITVGPKAAAKHIEKHGDTLGACP